MDETKKPEEIVNAVQSVESSLPELAETELNKVVGGTTTLSGACSTGKHFPTATLNP